MADQTKKDEKKPDEPIKESAAPVLPDPKPANVIQALAWVESQIGGIRKQRGRADGDEQRGVQYPFRGIDAIASAAQPLLGMAGVVILPESAVIDKIMEFQINSRPWVDTYVTVDWVIYGPGGVDDQIRSTTQGVGRDNSDKHYNKACTMAFKNLLLRLLCIGDPLDDTDGDNVQADTHGTQQGQQTRPRVTEVDPANDPVMGLFRRVSGLRGSTLGDEVKAFAESAGKPLTANAFNADRDWLAQVAAFLDERETSDPNVAPEPETPPVEGEGQAEPPAEPAAEPTPPKRRGTAAEIAAAKAEEK